MKTILAPTDFSAPSESAVRYAAALAQRLNAALFLLNVYEVPVSLSEVPALPVPLDELRENADNGLRRVSGELKEEFPGLSVSIESRLGSVIEEIRDICNSVQPFCMVTGHHHGSGLERVLFGSTSISLIHQLNLPLIVVPEGHTSAYPTRIALAVDRDGTNKADLIRSFTSELGAELVLVHVQTEANDQAPHDFDLPVHTVLHENFREGLEQFVNEERIDLLITIPHQHSWLEKWFFKTHTPQLLNHLNIPVMCVPE